MSAIAVSIMFAAVWLSMDISRVGRRLIEAYDRRTEAMKPKGGG